MRKIFTYSILLLTLLLVNSSGALAKHPIRIMVVTGGHNYEKLPFDEMLSSLGPDITSQVVEFPAAYDQFLPENRSNYDVLVFYHMWQKITPEQEKLFSETIREGKPLVVLHHSICAFDEWPEYWNIIGGKYFHKPTTVDGKEYAACTYIHDLKYMVNITKKKHPVTKGIKDFEIFDETYKGYYVALGVVPILTTTEKSSQPIIGWTSKYGKARVVTFQCGHAAPTFQNENFRKLLKQAIEWSYQGRK
jgi:type 1 glutamine amidotransferase